MPARRNPKPARRCPKEARRCHTLEQRILTAVLPILGLSPAVRPEIRLDLVRCQLVVQWCAAERQEQEVQEYVDEVLQHCVLRARVPASRDQLRTLVPRHVSWRSCQYGWQLLRKAIPTFPVPGMPLAGRVRIQDRLQQLLQITEEKRLFIERYPSVNDKESLVIRIGLDGTRKWRQKHELVAICVERGHRALGWSPVGFYFGSETAATLRAFIRACRWEAEVEGLQEVTLPKSGRVLPVVWCLAGDHMLRVACGDCDPPGSKALGRYLCGYCNATPTVCCLFCGDWGDVTTTTNTQITTGHPGVA